MHQLELLLLIKRYSDRKWKSHELARELYTSSIAVDDNLKRFLRDRLIAADDQEDGTLCYFYNHGEHDAMVDDLMEAYKNYRVRVIDAIFSKSTDGLKDFSDAFRFTKKKDET